MSKPYGLEAEDKEAILRRVATGHTSRCRVMWEDLDALVFILLGAYTMFAKPVTRLGVIDGKKGDMWFSLLCIVVGMLLLLLHFGDTALEKTWW